VCLVWNLTCPIILKVLKVNYISILYVVVKYKYFNYLVCLEPQM